MATNRLVIGAGLASRASFGGHLSVFRQYAQGFRHLGYAVTVVDPTSTDGEAIAAAARALQPGISYMSLPDDVTDERWAAVRRALEAACLLVNVNGIITDADLLDAAPVRLFLDIDPGFVQMWKALGLADVLRGHDLFATVGECVGSEQSAVPTCNVQWVNTRPPVVLSEWPAADQHSGTFTSVASWRGPFGPIEYEGRTYGLRVHEFRKFFELPRRAGQRFEVALDIDPAETADIEALDRHGWGRVEPSTVAGDVGSYRRYIQRSKAEFQVAKNLYIDTRGGWFSDRSVCYLASGKPVLAQDTGFSEIYPTDDGLLAYTTLEEAVAGVAAINAEYAHHARAARLIAEEHFDSDKVLSRLLDAIGVG